ncbi:MAG: YHYH domain-containing protein [Azonexus sp.]|nr:YHYH domain-containing protein [Azonexus sp.]
MVGLPKGVAAVVLFGWWIGSVYAHGGGLDANGCHFKRATGEYHCHRGSYAQAQQNPARQSQQHQAQPNRLYTPEIDSTCYTGPRGGRYRIVNGRKRYGC